PTAALVDRNAGRFQDLQRTLEVEPDGFIRTSVDPAHARGAGALWLACQERGDLYRRHYRGLYCVGCESFYTPEELVAGLCPEHETPPEVLEEQNWFFRLSRYRPELLRLLEDGRLTVVPESRRREVLAFVAGGLQDLSVSRSRERARGWGIPVPGDAGQVMYVWFDALANYITALGYPDADPAYRTFWADARSVHVIGKGILRFHAVYWPAFLLSAGLPLPDTVLVHGYLQAAGSKLSKSGGAAADPAEAAGRLGAEALRHWLLRVGPGADAEWSDEAVLGLRRTELANELGNLLQRTVSMICSYRAGLVPKAPCSDPELTAIGSSLAGRLQVAMGERLDPHSGLNSVWELVRAANRFANRTRPWQLAAAGDAEALDAVLAALAEALRVVAEALRPLLPGTAVRIATQLGVQLSAGDWLGSLSWSESGGGWAVSEPRPLFPK
ncbi:MAG: methionine--tRNA ligase, partial [Candidatus Dormibacteraeota bacterium]|nr:methionine--tRNA ligase [Candidatus Dormibacteraeota bacterium]